MLLGFQVESPKEGDKQGEEFEWVVTLRPENKTGIRAWGRNFTDRFFK